MCNQNRVTADDFLVQEVGVCLQPGRFPAILHLWEEYWHEQQQEAALEEWLGQFIAWLRQGEGEQPPGEAEEEAAL